MTSNFVFACKFCSQKFLSSKNLRNQICETNKHEPEVLTEKNISEMKSIKRENIEIKVKLMKMKESPTGPVLKDYEKISDLIYPKNQTFSCSICHKETSLEIHIKLHSLELKLSCNFPDCKIKFSTQKLM